MSGNLYLVLVWLNYSLKCYNQINIILFLINNNVTIFLSHDALITSKVNNILMMIFSLLIRELMNYYGEDEYRRETN